MRDSFLSQPIRFKETFQQPMRIKQSVVILLFWLSQEAKISTPLDQEGIGPLPGAFKKFVHFFRNSFFPVTKSVRSNFLISPRHHNREVGGKQNQWTFFASFVNYLRHI